MKDYLHARAVAALQQIDRIPAEKVTETKTTSDHPILFKQLKEWRRKLADEKDVPIYFIASQKLLLSISNGLPLTERQLKSLKGMGKKKIEQFGNEIISIVQNYCSENNVPANTEIREEPIPPKQDTKAISLGLFNEGKTIGQIAQLRQLTVTTIEGHLAHYIGTGELKLKQFLNENKSKIIMEYFIAHPGTGLSDAKAGIGRIRLLFRFTVC